ncbi:MAG: hypothetical protein OHK93_004115 [Ramalina farinacea]|uniref:Ketoreductase domain-containing protein n=1 Tax=Ramalina farinacea TaxID=258253 RepID=A0AA43TNX6_9LECA|nr:hypothetical protein [Ramalina farinacea]
MAAEQAFDVNMFTSPYQLTKSMPRDIYPAIAPTNPALSAKGKVVIITGAGGGLGAAVAKAWAQAGAAGIVLIGRSADTLKLTASNIDKINNSIPVIAEPTDIANEAGVKKLFSKVKAELGGKSYALVNCAGTMGGGQVGDVALTSWWADYETNVKGTFITNQAFIQAFGDTGTIINLVSTAVTMAVPGISSYASSKLAVMKLSQALSLEYPSLRTFSVHPGIVAAEDGRGMVIDAFTPFAKDTQALTGGLTLWLDTAAADFLKGGFVSANWDVEELVKHKDEIEAGKLTQLAFLNGKLGPEGHPWGSK